MKKLLFVMMAALAMAACGSNNVTEVEEPQIDSTEMEVVEQAEPIDVEMIPTPDSIVAEEEVNE